jgi:hypothetical protein
MAAVRKELAAGNLTHTIFRVCTHESRLFGNRWPPQTTCADCAAGSSGDLLPPSPPAEQTTISKPATIARIMAGGPPFYCPVQGKTDGGENDRLDAGAYHRSRRRLRHSISAVGPEIPSTKKRPLGCAPLSPGRHFVGP